MTASLPAWGAWIEIAALCKLQPNLYPSLPAWGAWIEIQHLPNHTRHLWSLPAWGAWIEITMAHVSSQIFSVAPRMGSVD